MAYRANPVVIHRHAMAPSPMLGRRQLTLFVPGDVGATLEPIRGRLDPVQHRLIRAHVTLGREDELAHLSDAELGARLACVHRPPLTLRFGPPEAFAGHGILLPCIAGEAEFHRLRMAVLGSESIRTHRAHITLAHPRNPRTTQDVAAVCATLAASLTITFAQICLIEQAEGQPWQVRQEICLTAGGI